MLLQEHNKTYLYANLYTLYNYKNVVKQFRSVLKSPEG